MGQILTSFTVAILVLVSCSEDGPAVADVIQEGETLTLELPGALLTIPAGSLPPGLEVKLSSQQAKDLNDPPENQEEVVVTPVYTVSFPGTQPTKGRIIVNVSVPKELTRDFYVLIRTVGGFTTHDVEDSGWVLGLGDYDATRSSLTIGFSATARRVSLVVVAKTPTLRSSAESVGAVARFLASSIPSVLGINNARAQGKPYPGKSDWELNSRGWVIVCRPGDFPIPETCASDSERLRRIAELAADASKTLRELKFDNANLHVTTIENIRLSGTPFVTVESDPPGIPGEYFVLVLRPYVESDTQENTKANTQGYYDLLTGVLVLSHATIDRSTLIHELLHAVQFTEIPSAWLRDWIIEGTATAVESLALEVSVDDSSGDVERDWRLALSSVEGLAEYETGEFWKFLDGTMSYLPALFSSIQAQSPSLSGVGDSPEDYSVVDKALQNVLGATLADSYLNLIQDRSKSDYEHCEEKPIFCSEKRCPLSESDIELDGKPMSALCFKIEADFSEADFSQSECQNLQLELKGEDAIHRFIVDDKVFRPNQTADAGEEFQLWVVNIDAEHAYEVIPEVILKCGIPVQIQSQTQKVTVRTSVMGNCVYGNCDEEFDYSYISQHYDILLGQTEIRTTTSGKAYTTAKREVQTRSASNGVEYEFSKSLTASADGSSANASLTTSIVQANGEFRIDGAFKVGAQAQVSGDAGADIEYRVSLSIGTMASVYITNCDLLEITGMIEEVSRNGGECKFRTNLSAEDIAIGENRSARIQDLVGMKLGDNSAALTLGNSVHISTQDQSFESSEVSPTDADEKFSIRIVPD
jgi:hypothetical protein